MIAQVGHINTNLEQITGVHGLYQINVNGGLFTELCAKNNLTIGGTLSHTERFTKLLGCHLTTKSNANLPHCHKQQIGAVHYWMCEIEEALMDCQTITWW